ncbi:MAG: Asp-tRNA(Asn)/Glu-tRNA(Gln) amidotransferase subunit GatC [bacterium]|nr:Asp-tRNA(Asn)/Glu-tRNA(Gln) amidotransferase subunit GatC [bacterium]MDZ4299727.1 Asp-tRNA(Asn)/Glu-tRNA(Gln) amidotransferase subunit GatC [Candidatus Sungbacteria bacterium]
MVLSRDEIKHIAMLARLELTPEEEERFGGELSVILGFIGQLSVLGEIPTRTIGIGENPEAVLRSDVAQGEQDESFFHVAPLLAAAAPETREGFFVVPKVFE